MNRLKGKVALVTGGSSGIGFATAKLFAEEGARVFIAGRRREELEAAAACIGQGVVAIRCDIANLADLDHLFEQIQSKADRIDILFANAGLGEFAPLGSIDEAHFDKTFDVNVKGTLFTVQNALPLMRPGASIILNGSITSIKGNAAFSVYSATKAALRSLARSWILDLRDRQIRVNVVSPGTIPTPGYDSFHLTEEEMAAFLRTQSEATPMGRVGRPEEIAHAVLFLASAESSYVNGAELFVDGGLAQI